MKKFVTEKLFNSINRILCKMDLEVVCFCVDIPGQIEVSMQVLNVGDIRSLKDFIESKKARYEGSAVIFGLRRKNNG